MSLHDSQRAFRAMPAGVRLIVTALQPGNFWLSVRSLSILAQCSHSSAVRSSMFKRFLEFREWVRANNLRLRP